MCLQWPMSPFQVKDLANVKRSNGQNRENTSTNTICSRKLAPWIYRSSSSKGDQKHVSRTKQDPADILGKADFQSEKSYKVHCSVL